MATRSGAAPAKAAKKTVVITTENLQDVLNGEFNKLDCCAFLEYTGLEYIRSIEDAVALRRAASGDLRGHEDEDEEPLEVETADRDDVDHKGAILVTSIQSQSRVYPFLLGAGFSKLGTFKGNGQNQVTLWGAQALQPGKVEPKGETRETVVLS